MRRLALATLAVIAAIGCTEARAEEPKISTNEEIAGWIQDLVDCGYRRPGTEAGLKAEQYIKRKFEEFGLDQVRLESIEIDVWHRDKWSLTVKADGQQHAIPCFPMPFSKFTSTDGTHAELVYVGEGKESNYDQVSVDGKIALVDIRFLTLPAETFTAGAYLSYDPDNTAAQARDTTATWISPNREAAYQQAVKAGAVGVVGILKDMPANKCTLYAPYPDPRIEPAPLPMVYIGRDDGAKLRERLQAGAVQARLTYLGRVVPGTTHNVVGILPGKSEDAILISSHHDSPFAGAVEDGSGMSMVLALAKYFGSIPAEKRDKTLWFVASAGHHYGGIGIRTFMKQHAEDLNPSLLCAVHLEHIAREFIEQDGRLVDSGMPQPSAIFVSDNPVLIEPIKQAVVRHNLDRTGIMPSAWGIGGRPPGESSAYHSIGIPNVGLISGPVYLLFEDDTFDKVAVDRLAPTAAVFADVITSYDRTPSEQIRPRAEGE